MFRLKLSNHFIICGAGRVGSKVAEELKERNIPFIIIEKNPKVVKKLKSEGYKVIEGDCLDEDVLRSANIEKCKGVIACMGEDEDNLFVVLTAEQVNRKIITISRANDESAIEKLKSVNVDYIVMPELMGAKEIANIVLKEMVESELKE